MIYAYIFVMAGVTYLIRMLPLTLVQKKITNIYVRSFLYYIPYACLTAIAAFCGFIMAVFMGLRKKSLIVVALSACTVVFLVERIVEFL